MVWVQTMANRFSQSSSELANLQVLKSLQAKNGDREGQATLRPAGVRGKEDPGAPTTVPRAESASPNDEPHAMSQEAELSDVTQALPDANLTRMKNAGGGTWPHVNPDASNLWITGRQRTVGANSVLLNGPQFQWFNPSYVFGIGLHGAGYDFAGNTPFAVPGGDLRHQQHHRLGRHRRPPEPRRRLPREAASDRLDAGICSAVSYRDMTVRTEIIKVKGAADVRHDVLSTVHGFVTSVDEANRSAYSKKRSWSGLEIRSLMAWVKVEQGEELAGVLRPGLAVRHHHQLVLLRQARQHRLHLSGTASRPTRQSRHSAAGRRRRVDGMAGV